jgi:hypothetical protein
MPEVRYWSDERARQALVERGRATLAGLRSELDGQSGVVAVEVESGDWFVGETLGQANAAAYNKYPDRWVYFCRLDDVNAEIALPTW